MVLQIAPDALTIEHDIDAKRRKPLRRPDAGAMQHLRRSDRAGAENDFAPGASLDRLIALYEAYTDRTAVLDR